ncbi:MAG: ribonuclease P protein component [Chloroflexi bacterium CG23_combo_of_CG06-09_8_20_14_all_45_10]|nr:MAG: ribonuclease P protein component [Chloroflexi bacterium CG23_combo_of_CG06-09_8_20_14_all_45_10]
MKGPWVLTKRAQYALVYQQGRTYIDSLIVMKALPNGLNLSRYGFSVTKKVGKAVQRNRLKRLLREITRLQLVKPGWDIVFIVRREAVAADYHQLGKTVTMLLAQAQLLQRSDETASAKVN